MEKETGGSLQYTWGVQYEYLFPWNDKEKEFDHKNETVGSICVATVLTTKGTIKESFRNMNCRRQGRLSEYKSCLVPLMDIIYMKRK